MKKRKKLLSLREADLQVVRAAGEPTNVPQTNSATDGIGTSPSVVPPAPPPVLP